MLLRNENEQEVISREKKDRRDFGHLSALATRMGLHCCQFDKVVVFSKVPLPNYRPDLDSKRPQREVVLPHGLQDRVNALLKAYCSKKSINNTSSEYDHLHISVRDSPVPYSPLTDAQSLIFLMLLSAVTTTIFHVVVCWALVFWFNLGSVGGGLSVGLSNWFNAALLALYMMFSASCPNTRNCLWKDLSFRMGEFFQFAVPSSSMACLEMWTFEVIVLLGGLLPNPQLETYVLSICLMTISLHYYIPFSVGAGTSTRISNELGAGNTETTKMATWAVMVLGFAEMLVASIAVLACGNILGYAFSAEEEVVNYITKMCPLISVMYLSGTQGVLSGVARGSGWQHLGAYVNLAAYYLVGVPVAVVLGFWVGLGGMGLWVGLNVASMLKTIVFLLITIFTDWEKQAAIAKERLMCQSSSGRLSERLIID